MIVRLATARDAPPWLAALERRHCTVVHSVPIGTAPEVAAIGLLREATSLGATTIVCERSVDDGAMPLALAIARRSIIPVLLLPSAATLPSGVIAAVADDGWREVVLQGAEAVAKLLGGGVEPFTVPSGEPLVPRLVAVGAGAAPRLLMIGMHRGGSPGERPGRDIAAAVCREARWAMGVVPL